MTKDMKSQGHLVFKTSPSVCNELKFPRRECILFLFNASACFLAGLSRWLSLIRDEILWSDSKGVNIMVSMVFGLCSLALVCQCLVLSENSRQPILTNALYTCHVYYRLLQNNSLLWFILRSFNIFFESSIRTLMDEDKLCTHWLPSKELDVDLPTCVARRQTLIPTKEQENWMRKKSRSCSPSSATLDNSSSPTGSSIDRKTSRMESTLNWLLMLWITNWEKILRDWRRSKLIEDWDTTGDWGLEDSIQRPLEEEEEPLESPRRREHKQEEETCLYEGIVCAGHLFQLIITISFFIFSK